VITHGLNYSQTHDSPACIIRDGEVLSAVVEERISRTKHDARFLQMAIRACLNFAKVRPDQIDEAPQ
jgi:predicted NodU family carbamoyl transferase